MHIQIHLQNTDTKCTQQLRWTNNIWAGNLENMTSYKTDGNKTGPTDALNTGHFVCFGLSMKTNIAQKQARTKMMLIAS